MSRCLLLLGNAASPHVDRWALHFVSAGWDVHVASFQSAARGYAVQLLRPALPGRAGYLTVLPQLRRLASRIRPTLVHAHYATSYGLLGALMGTHPYVISAWGSDLNEWGQEGPLQRAMLRFSFDRADLVTGPVQDLVTKAQAIGSARARFEVTPFGVDTDLFSPGPVPEGRLVVGTVRPQEWRYGMDILIEAFGQLGMPDVELHVIGRGPDRERYLARLAELGVGDRVSMAERVSHDELIAAYRRFAVFVAPSRMEGICVSCLEANACGTPAVVTRVGGLPEVVEDGVTGYVVPPEDPAALAAALRRLLQDDARRSEMGRAARQRVLDRFNWAENAALMERLYGSLLGSSPSCGSHGGPQVLT